MNATIYYDGQKPICGYCGHRDWRDVSCPRCGQYVNGVDMDRRRRFHAEWSKKHGKQP